MVVASGSLGGLEVEGRRKPVTRSDGAGPMEGGTCTNVLDRPLEATDEMYAVSIKDGWIIDNLPE